MKQIVLAVVAWLAHGRPPDSESRRRRNHEPPKSGIPKRKKTATHNRLSCKIEYLLRSNHCDGSIASEFFTGDSGSMQEALNALRDAGTGCAMRSAISVLKPIAIPVLGITGASCRSRPARCG